MIVGEPRTPLPSLTPKVSCHAPIDLFENVVRVGHDGSANTYELTVRVGAEFVESLLHGGIPVSSVRLQPVGRELELVFTSPTNQVLEEKTRAATDE